MAKEEVTKGLGGNGKMKQEYINIAERRLSFTGGTLLVEVGAAIAERYGRGKAILRDHKRLIFHNRVMQERYQIELQERRSTGPPKSLTFDEAKAMIAKDTFDRSFTTVELEGVKAMKVEGEETFRKERATFSEMTKTYIIEEYGEEIKDQYGKISNYGERIEVLPNSHLRKIW